MRLVIYQAMKFENTGIEIEELISVGTLGLLKGINSYNFGKNIKLATYVSKCIDNEILMYLRKNKKHSVVTSLDEPLNVDLDGNELKYKDILGYEYDYLKEQIKIDRNKVIYEMIDSLNEIDKEIVLMYFGFYNNIPSTQKEIADRLGISQSYVSRKIVKIVENLKVKAKTKRRTIDF